MWRICQSDTILWHCDLWNMAKTFSRKSRIWREERDNQKIPQKVQSCSGSLPVMGWAFCSVTSYKNQRLLNFDSHEKAPCLTDQDIENDNVALYGIISNLSSVGQCLKLTNQIALLLVQYFSSIGPVFVLNYKTARCIFEDFLSF